VCGKASSLLNVLVHGEAICEDHEICIMSIFIYFQEKIV